MRGQRVEVYRDPVSSERRYRALTFAERGEQIQLTELSDTAVSVDDLLPIVDR